MGMTIGQILSELEKPENESEIKHLAHLKNLSNLEGLKQKTGSGGIFSRLILRFIQKHMDAFIALSECKTNADITAFKETNHYKKIKSTQVGEGMALKNLADLADLQNL